MIEYEFLRDLPQTLSAEDVAEFLGISRAGGYKLLNSEGFPTLKVGKRIMVTKHSFIKWLEENSGI